MVKGVIFKIDKDKVSVSIQCQTACAQCSQHHICSTETKVKEITIKKINTEQYKIGQVVELIVGYRSMLLSILFAYGIPLFLILGMLVLGTIREYSETKTGILALLSLIPYYIFLFIFNSRMKKYFTIKIAENPVD